MADTLGGLSVEFPTLNFVEGFGSRVCPGPTLEKTLSIRRCSFFNEVDVSKFQCLRCAMFAQGS